MKRFISNLLYFCFLNYSLLYSTEDLPILNLDGGAVSIVNGCVSVITGDYIDTVCDVEIAGPEKLTFERSFCSSGSDGTLIAWRHNHDGQLEGSANSNSAVYKSKEGRSIGYNINGKFEKYLNKSFTNFSTGTISGRTHIKNSYMHIGKHSITLKAENGDNIKFLQHRDNQYKYTVGSEEKNNGNMFRYIYTDKNFGTLKSIKSLDRSEAILYSEITINPADLKEFTKTVDTSDSRQVLYKIQQFPKTKKYNFERFRIKEVIRPSAPFIKYEYSINPEDVLQLRKKVVPDGRFLGLEYYGVEEEFTTNRVKKLFAPVGFDDSPITTYEFVFDKDKDIAGNLRKGATYVHDANRNLTVYEYGRDYRISQVRKYRGSECSTEKFYWSEEGNLLFHLTKDETQTIYAAKELIYDKSNNVIKEIFYGKLQGSDTTISFEKIKKKYVLKGTDSSVTHYKYTDDKRNLLLEEKHPNGKIVQYVYESNHDLLSKKFTLENDVIKIREFYVYDKFALLKKTIKDDGSARSSTDLTSVTERLITKRTNQQVAPYGLPIQIEECYLDLETGQEVLLKKIKNQYSRLGHLTLKQTYDANDVLRYQERFEYDDHGNVILEENALGQITTKQYNANDECIYEKCHDKAFHTENVYDFAGRRIATKEIHEDGTTLVTSFEYNLLNQLVAKIDPYGQRTEFKNDVFGNQIKTTSPTYIDPTGVSITPTTSSEFDFFGNEISKTDVFGKTTRISKNVRGKPTQIISPDGAIETMEYETDGTVRKTVGKNGLVTLTSHDCLGRLLSKECYSSNGEFLSKISSTYNSFHKLTDVDAKGTVTEYTYFSSGLLKSTKKENSLTEYGYDEFQRPNQTKVWVSENSYILTTKTHDFLNRVIEERVEDENAHCHKLEQYTYDAYGNRTEMSQQRPNGISITKTCYDSQSRPIKSIDPEGNVTQFNYTPIYHNGQQVIEIESQDALGILTITRMNIFGKPESIIRKNGFGDIIAKKEIGYDAAQNVAFAIETAVTIKPEKDKKEDVPQIEDKEILTKWIYNEQNLPITLIEAVDTPDQKVTEYRYNSMGEKTQIIKHDGTVIDNTYDDFGRLKSFKSSDNSLSYSYEYDLNGNVIKSIDHINDQITYREYDLSDNMTKEILGTGLEINYTYDFMGRPIQVTLSDSSCIAYEYNPLLLSKVTRFSKEGQEVYSHTYNEYDLSGNLLNETKPLNIGDCDYQYNLNGQLTNINSKFFSEKIYYDKVGNITSCEIGNTSQNIHSKYTYDDLNQLSSEDGIKTHHYVNDSLFNCVEKDGNKQDTNYLNQLIKTVDQSFQYDKSGNRIADGKYKYTYDTLDRLTSVATDTQVFTYTYDSFNRRLSKSSNNQKTDFLYFGQNEVGSYENGILKEFRALGTGKGAEIGASIALEIQNQIFVPIHDHNGNIVAIINSDGQAVENYRYSAYGEEKVYDHLGNEIDNPINPWRFSSKRVDAETDLINFGRRYYDCKTTKWMSPDPIGFEGGPNLYAYVNNNPLSHFDLYGLELFRCRHCGSTYRVTSSSDMGYYYDSPNYSQITPQVGGGYATISALHRPPNNNQNGYFVVRDQHDRSLSMPSLGMGNGMGNDFSEGMSNTAHLHRLSGGVGVIGTYDKSYGFFGDVFSCIQRLMFGSSTEEVQQLHSVWREYLENAKPGARFLQICHSRGAINVRNALMSFPENLRKQIDVIAIAPGAYIEEKYCGSVVHYVSERDFVPLFDQKGRNACRHTTVTLPPDKNAPLWDHSFQSPTYADVLESGIKNFTSKNGIIK